jgi:hypothetical protein
MDKDERNRIMDGFFNEPPEGSNAMMIRKGGQSYEAIRECDRLARAWDGLEEWLAPRPAEWASNTEFSQGMKRAYEVVREHMSILLARPAPKDPLEELEEWVTENQETPDYPPKPMVHLDDLLAEIRRLRGKK